MEKTTITKRPARTFKGVARPYKRNTDYLVQGGMSLKGKDIRSRLYNGTLQPSEGGGQYIIDDELAKISKMSKIDLAREQLKGNNEITNLKNKLANDEANRKKAEERKRSAASAGDNPTGGKDTSTDGDSNRRTGSQGAEGKV